MAASPYFQFVSDLASAFNSGKISLPSFPDIVIRIRRTLEQDDVDIAKVSQVVKTDPVLVSRLFVFANSSSYNPIGNRIDSVEVALSRLGLDLVRNTAISLAVRQMFLAQDHKDLKESLGEIWQESMKLAAMCSALADGRRAFKEETAFICGLMHYVGKLYIITKAKNYPEFVADPAMLEQIMDEWHPKIGKCIVESWNFSSEIAETVDWTDHMSDYRGKAPSLVDIVVASTVLLRHVNKSISEGKKPAAEPCHVEDLEMPAMERLGIVAEELPHDIRLFREKLGLIREALAKG